MASFARKSPIGTEPSAVWIAKEAPKMPFIVLVTLIRSGAMSCLVAQARATMQRLDERLCVVKHQNS